MRTISRKRSRKIDTRHVQIDARPDHQEERGIRYGNKRKYISGMKAKIRRAEKRTSRVKALKEGLTD